jgi:cell division protein FtsI/penicillin-binding protein 2
MATGRAARTAETRLGLDRLHVLSALVLCVAAGIVARLAYLQIFNAGTFATLAESQRTRTADLLPRRGTIALSEEGDARLFPIATTRRTATAFAVPRDIKDLDRTVERLVDIILQFEQREEERRERLLVGTGQFTPKEAEDRRNERARVTEAEQKEHKEGRRLELLNDFRKRLGNPLDPYEPLVASFQKLDDIAIAQLRSADLPGIVLQDVPERYYPERTLAAHVLGIVRGDGIETKGEYGLESALDRVLQGAAGYLESERDVIGRWISVGGVELVPARDGADVVLTLDRVVQTVAESVAKEGREKFKAERASIIVMDPTTGGITAMANYPTFDPNFFGDIRDVGILRNSAVSDLFEPGSIFKPIIMSIALDQGLVTPQTTMEDRGPLHIGGFVIDTYDGKHFGTTTMTEILEHSNNVGMVWVAQKIGAEKLYAALRRFGIGDKTGIPLADEGSRSLPSPDTWSKATLATVGFGQSVVVTPLQILTANGALINGGKLLEPHIVKEVRYADGRVDTVERDVIREVVSPETSTRISAMMTSVVENGVGQLAKVKGYYVGGKTGTAQVVDPATGRYASDRKVISFIGFAPAENPKFIALIKLDNPQGLSFASGTAAPMFHDLAERLLDYYRVPPSRDTVEDPLKKIKEPPGARAG